MSVKERTNPKSEGARHGSIIAMRLDLGGIAGCCVHSGHLGCVVVTLGANNMKQILLGIHSFQDCSETKSDSTDDSSPQPTIQSYPTGCIGPGDTLEQRLSWVVQILPHLEHDQLAKQINIDHGFAGNLEQTKIKIPMFRCPATKIDDRNLNTTTYVAMSGIGPNAAMQPEGVEGNGFMGYDRKTSTKMIKDGLSNTIFLMETHRDLGPWARGGSATVRGFDPNESPLLGGEDRPFYAHTNVTTVGMGDGSGRSLRAKTDLKRVAASITIAGGEKENLD
jgi:hypothetical protein